MADLDTDVLVAGAGPTVLTLARALAQWGVRVRVVDAAPAPSRGSRAEGLQPRSLEVLDGLGLAGRLVAHGRFRMPLRRYIEIDDRVGVAHEMQAGVEASPDRPWVRTLFVPQSRVEEAAANAARRSRGRGRAGPRRHRPGAGRGRRRTVLADGSSITARYLVGCDGGSSAVRRLLGVSFLGETRDDVRMLLADVVLDGLDRDHWHQFGVARERRFAMLCPLPSTAGDAAARALARRRSGHEHRHPGRREPRLEARRRSWPARTRACSTAMRPSAFRWPPTCSACPRC